MAKRLISMVITMVMVLSLVSVIQVQAAGINIGDYVVMGKYYDEPILWRCVDIDENGPLMLADKILCLKEFDSPGLNHGSTYHLESGFQWPLYYGEECGSNLWEKSNVRAWLNSKSTEGTIRWLCDFSPNTYQYRYISGFNLNESGFLSSNNFTLSEINAIKEVKLKTALGYIYGGCASRGSYNVYRTDISNIAYYPDDFGDENYSFSTDKLFLLDNTQIGKILLNSNKLGSEYYLGKPTQKLDSRQPPITPFSTEQTDKTG